MNHVVGQYEKAKSKIEIKTSQTKGTSYVGGDAQRAGPQERK